MIAIIEQAVAISTCNRRSFMPLGYCNNCSYTFPYSELLKNLLLGVLFLIPLAK